MIREERRRRDREWIPPRRSGARATVNMTARTIGLAMREQRDLAGVSIFTMAAELDVLSTTVSAWERGVITPPLLQLYRYARVCGVSIREVLP